MIAAGAGPWLVAGAGLLVALLAFTVVWAVSIPLEDASIVDAFWAPGFLLVGVTYAVVAGEGGTRTLVILGLVALWAGRLGLHLLRRNRRSGEDRRYRAMRERATGSFAWRSLFTVFWLQAGLLWLISAPLLGVVLAGGPWGWLDSAGVGLFLVGFTMEAVADAQLEAFKARAGSGAVMDQGLWRYSRHPNYFGDALLWWGLYLLAVGAGAWWTAYGPALMTVLLLKVSGVALLERDIEERRPEYADYVRRTSAFVPLPPRES